MKSENPGAQEIEFLRSLASKCFKTVWAVENKNIFCETFMHYGTQDFNPVDTDYFCLID